MTPPCANGDTRPRAKAGAPINKKQLETYISSVVSSSDDELGRALAKFGRCFVYLVEHGCKWPGGESERHLLEMVEQWSLFFADYSAESVFDLAVLYAANRPGGWWPSPAQVLKKATEY